MKHASRPFTLIEILIVLVIAGLVMSLALPAMLQKSDRTAVESALTEIRNAIGETGMRARATGKALALTLDEENHCFAVSEYTEQLDRSWTPPSQNLEDGEGRAPSFIKAKPSYPLADDIQWVLDNGALNDDGEMVLVLFPDGQASARKVSFSIRNRSFLLDVDRITGDPVILEEH